MSVVVQRGLGMASYLAIDAASASLLHVLSTQTPMHAHVYMTTPREDTKALILGEAVHYAILEPELFDLRYAVPPKADKRTTAGKEAWAQWLAEHPTQVPLTADEYDAARGMLAATAAHGEALRYLEAEGANEITLTWTDEETGLACKARPDRVARVDGRTWVVDVKTCRSASPHGFAKAIAEYGYHRKSAWYLDALDLLDPRPRQFLFVATENKAPYALALYQLTDDAIQQGRTENRAALKLLATCKQSGIWPGYPADITYLDLPRWAQKGTE
jgi:exodeoxyribonuclease VIII